MQIKNRASAEGDTKVSVHNGSRLIDRHTQGQWLTMKGSSQNSEKIVR
ncbi:hypothetical protein [Burkholderia sp. SRS-W-2-2016]|nr:hypothetical protein [Burkholderia sp. SRS-W-2-2016]